MHPHAYKTKPSLAVNIAQMGRKGVLGTEEEEVPLFSNQSRPSACDLLNLNLSAELHIRFRMKPEWHDKALFVS